MSNKTSDKNVEIVKELIQEYKTYGDLDGIQDMNLYIEAIVNILIEREQDKKYIKNLEIALKIINKLIYIDEAEEKSANILKEISRMLGDMKYGRG